MITLFNKQDKLESAGSYRDFQAEYSIPASAKTGEGLAELKKALLEIVRREQIYVERLYDFSEASKIPAYPKSWTTFVGEVCSGRD